MERKGVYRKGRAGHARNASSFRIYREHMKKWRVPFTALMALFVVFATAPAVGDELQTSLLTTGQVEEMHEIEPVEGRKLLLSMVDEFVKECEKFRVVACSEEGKKVSADIASASVDLSLLVHAVEEFASRFEEQVAQMACRQSLAEVIAAGNEQQRTLSTFVEKYGDVLQAPSLEKQVTQLAEVNQALNAVVQYCERQ